MKRMILLKIVEKNKCMRGLAPHRRSCRISTLPPGASTAQQR